MDKYEKRSRVFSGILWWAFFVILMVSLCSQEDLSLVNGLGYAVVSLIVATFAVILVPVALCLVGVGVAVSLGASHIATVGLGSLGLMVGVFIYSKGLIYVPDDD